MSIANVNFGRIDAESDDLLSTYFVDTGSFAKLKKGQKSFVIGRKGSGKTAIFQKADFATIGHPVRKVDFHDYPWAAHRAIAEDGVIPEAAFVASWRFFFLTSVVKYWADYGGGTLAGEARTLLNRIYQNDNPGVQELLIDKLKRVRRIDLPSVAGGGGIEIDEEKDPGKSLARSASQWNTLLTDFTVKHWRANPVTLIADRLDDGWDATDQSKQLLIGVLKATRDINLKLASNGVASAIITLLRSDIYDNLQFNDKNKLNADIELLEWTERSLIEVAEARISLSLGIQKLGAWSRVFSQEEMRQRASIQSYILKRTMLRPRDLIAFCIKCQEAAAKAGRGIVETADVYTAEEAYASHMYDELDDEMHKQHPDARELMQVIRDIARTRFDFKDWQKALSARLPGTTEEIAKDKLRILFEYSVVGVPRAGGSGGGTTFLYAYNDRLLEPDFRGEMSVHPSLKKPLKITEGRRT